MNIENIGSTNLSPPRANEPAQQVERKRQENRDQAPAAVNEDKVPAEELLSQIKAITENGLYSVRFEQDTTTEQLVVKIVDNDTDEIIRQIPPQELIALSKHLKELRGNMVNTVS